MQALHKVLALSLASKLERTHLPNALGNGIIHSLTQNLRGLPLVNRDAGVMQDQYSYDANGNVTAIADQQEAVFSRAMTYDDLDRLWTANAPGVWGNATYTYDAVDNLRTASVGSRSSTLNYDGSNRLSSIVTNGSQTNYGYDARGNISSKGGQSFAFDLGNRLRSASLGGGYTYDGHGRRFRVASSDGSTRLQLYSQAGQILWATSSGGPRPAGSTAYIYLGGKQIAEWASAGNQTQYVHTDALGSPVAHTNASGGLMNRTRFEPYGFTAAGTKPGPNTSSIGFTGHVNDPETDLVYMQQRYYDPIAGRFLSVDPIVTDADSGKGFGRYTYVNNNPYKYKDPDGKAAIAIAIPVVVVGVVGHYVLPGREGRERSIANGFRALLNAVKPDGDQSKSGDGNGKSGGNAADDAVSGLVDGLSPEAGGKKGHFVKPGGDAEADLEALPGETGSNGQKTLPDGSVAGTHVSTTTGAATLHINRPSGKRDVKIRYPQPEKKQPPEEKPEKQGS